MLLAALALAACVSEEDPIGITEFDDYLPSTCETEIADGDSTTPLACEFAIPEGAKVDPSKIQIVYYPGPMTQGINFHQVADLQDCDGYGFYVTEGVVHLCPAACDLVQNGDPKATLEILLGCDEPG